MPSRKCSASFALGRSAEQICAVGLGAAVAAGSGRGGRLLSDDGIPNLGSIRGIGTKRKQG
jgi:hypothetical protein